MIRLLTENEQEKEELTAEIKSAVEKCISYTLGFEGCEFDAEISLTYVDDERIREINLSERNIDAPTDVLSFPMCEFDENGDIIDADYDGDYLLLGDIVISAERARKQAEEYGHSFLREIAFLTVHSMLHLLGYDHVDDEEGERVMFEKQETILNNLNITR